MMFKTLPIRMSARFLHLKIGARHVLRHILMGLLLLGVSGSPALARETQDKNALLQEISTFFQNLTTLEGSFVQFGPDGTQTEGVFYIQRPGKMRFQYAPPANIEVISDGRSVSVTDKKLKTQDIWPLSKTPLRFLLTDNEKVFSRVKPKDMHITSTIIAITVYDRRNFGGGLITLFFDPKTLELKQWTITDEQGLKTTVVLSDVIHGGVYNPELFKIDYLAAHRQRRK